MIQVKALHFWVEVCVLKLDMSPGTPLAGLKLNLFSFLFLKDLRREATGCIGSAHGGHADRELYRTLPALSLIQISLKFKRAHWASHARYFDMVVNPSGLGP